MADFNDFGFTSVTQDELSELTGLKKEQDRATRLYSAILPLLQNLMENPEKDYIYWPRREEKIKDFRNKLELIYNGD